MVGVVSDLCRLYVWQPAVAAFGVALAAGPVFAQDLPAAPQYYLDYVVGVSLAEQYAVNCPGIEVSQEALVTAQADVKAKLEADGFPTVKPHEHMTLPPNSETDGIIFGMLERNQKADDPQAAFCTEATQEIAAGGIAGIFMFGTAQ